MKSPTSSSMKSVSFRSQRERTWAELEDLVGRVEKKGLAKLSADELQRLPVLYRATMSSLSVARSISLDRNLLDYLEHLAARAYVVVYTPRRRLRDQISEFFLETFPTTVVRYWRQNALSAAILIAGMCVAWAMTLSNPENFYSFVDSSYAQGRGPEAATEDLAAMLYDGGDIGTDELGAFSAQLMSHNARIGMLAFVLGFAAGIPAIYLLFTNGLTLGAFAGLYQQRGLGVDLWGWLLPHGITELSAVILCGGGGLILAGALIFPGEHTRLENLKLRGRDAGVIVIGAVIMFCIAALIEGFFRQMVTDVTVRYSVATLTFVLWGAYFLRAGLHLRARNTAAPATTQAGGVVAQSEAAT